MDLYICEKPSQAKDLAGVLKIKKKEDGYFQDGSRYVTWGYGHLLELLMPEEYDEKYKSWSADLLPIIPEAWKSKIKSSGYKQYKVIEALVKQASTVYIATDFDREGEAIARSILDRCRYNGTIKRVCLTALDDTSIKKALNNIRDGRETIALYFASIARTRADWMIGMNFSRLYTSLGRSVNYKETLHIGRVLSPVISIVCDRDKEIKNFVSSPYWVLNVGVAVQNGQFLARWIPNNKVADDKGRCINRTFIEQVSNQVKGAKASISKAETKLCTESAPLPFDLGALQRYASSRWGYSIQQVLDGAQSLYETHKATTYPRPDSRFLPESQIEDVPGVLQALILSDQNISGLVAGANADRKGRAFNDKKVTAHHAIIPTSATVDISAMSELEFNLYDAIRRYYIAQFYSEYEYSNTVIHVSVGQHIFEASGNVPVKHGWKVLFASDLEINPIDDEDEANVEADDTAFTKQKLPRVNQGEAAIIRNKTVIADKMTRASPHFTEATLLGAMENISRFVTEETFKKILNETSGLGTPATRAGILQGAIDKGYLVKKGRKIKASEKAFALISVLPPALKSPGLTAAWEQELEKIAAGTTSMSVFLQNITKWTSELVNQVKLQAEALTKENGLFAEAFSLAKPEEHKCPTCGGVLARRYALKGEGDKQTKSFFWGCQNRVCNKTFPDNRGKPGERISVEDCPNCEECGKTMRLRSGKAPGKKRSSKFWACSGYPDCKNTSAYKKKTG